VHSWQVTSDDETRARYLVCNEQLTPTPASLLSSPYHSRYLSNSNTHAHLISQDYIFYRQLCNALKKVDRYKAKL